jgi:hypothetical protein
MYGNETIIMNTSSSGLMTFASQSSGIGTIAAIAILIGLISGAVMSAHSWNTKGWLYKLVKFLILTVGENALYGIATTTVVGGVYYIGSEMAKFGDANPHFLADALIFCGQGLVVIAGLVVVGWITKPVWNYVHAYAQGKEKRVR